MTYETKGSWPYGWGPYRSVVGDALASCVDYVGRLQRSFNAEIASDHFYFLDKASALLEAAELLVSRCEEVDRWISEEPQMTEEPR
jgi:hypothetical protein